MKVWCAGLPHKVQLHTIVTVKRCSCGVVEPFLGISQGHCGGLVRGMRSLAVRTKPSSVLAGRKLLMRLDGLCRHYLAMTKSALFLLADGGKFNSGREKSIHKQQLQTDAGYV